MYIYFNFYWLDETAVYLHSLNSLCIFFKCLSNIGFCIGNKALSELILLFVYYKNTHPDFCNKLQSYLHNPNIQYSKLPV